MVAQQQIHDLKYTPSHYFSTCACDKRLDKSQTQTNNYRLLLRRNFSVSDRHLLIAAERERVDPLVRSECFRLTGDVDKTQHPTLSMPLLPFS